MMSKYTYNRHYSTKFSNIKVFQVLKLLDKIYKGFIDIFHGGDYCYGNFKGQN